MDNQPKDPITDPRDEKIVKNPKLSIWEALIPVVALIGMLSYNVFVYGDASLNGSNQFILLLGAAVAVIVGFFNKVSFEFIVEEVAQNIKSTAGAILILLMVGALTGTWLLSGVIPTMIYYGMQVLNPSIFLPACVIICSIISVATGSSWSTSATVGIALIGIAGALGIPLGMTAGAVISGAYFGDKMSPLSDTTNLAPAIAGAGLFDHIRYMTITTVPTMIITLIVFIILGLNLEVSGQANPDSILTAIEEVFTISPWLFVVPLVVILLIVKKTSPLIALMIGTLLGAIFAIFMQSEIIWSTGLRYDITKIPDEYKNYVTWDGNESNPSTAKYQTSGTYSLIPLKESITLSEPIKMVLPQSNTKVEQDFSYTSNIIENGNIIGSLEIEAIPTNYAVSAYFATMNSMTVETVIPTTNEKLTDLFTAGGMAGMLPTIWLIICAMAFGGAMDAIGALARISKALLNMFHTTFGLFASTVMSCLAINLTAADQYLAIVVPGKMFKKAFDDKNLDPVNLSRTLEDTGTVTSALVPWNTCGAYQSSVLGVSVVDYLFYAVFNYVSPFMTLLVAAIGYKIKYKSPPKTV